MLIKLLIPVCLLLNMVVSTAQASPRIQQWYNKHGVPVYFVASDALPIVDLRIVFDAGSARDSHLPGTAVLTNGLLAEGSDELTAQQIAEKFESVGAEFSNGALRDMAWLSLRSLRDDRYLIPALKTLHSVLTKPAFSEQAFQRELAHMKVSWKASRQSPSSLAEEAFYAAVYGNHPYALPSGGTELSLNTMTRQQVVDFYKRFYVANNAVIAIVGDLSRPQAENMANNLTEGLQKGIKAPELPEVPELKQAVVKRIDFPSKQSHIMIGEPGMKRGDKDYFTLYVANHPFGGSGFTSRLVEEVRENRGLAYSVYSYFLPSRELGPFLIGMQTKTTQVDEALKLLHQQLDTYIEQGPTEDELENSQMNITGGFPLRIDSNKKIVEYLAMIGFYQLPLDYLHNFNRRVEAVNVETIKRVIKQRIHPQKMVTIIVGANSDENAQAE